MIQTGVFDFHSLLFLLPRLVWKVGTTLNLMFYSIPFFSELHNMQLLNKQDERLNTKIGETGSVMSRV